MTAYDGDSIFVEVVAHLKGLRRNCAKRGRVSKCHISWLWKAAIQYKTDPLSLTRYGRKFSTPVLKVQCKIRLEMSDETWSRFESHRAGCCL